MSARAEICVDGRLSLAGFGDDLREHRKGHVVGELAEGGDLFTGAGLLLAEIVARKPEDGKPLVLQLAMQLLETFVLRRVAAIARDVDDQAHLATIVGKVSRFAEKRLRLQVIE